MKKLILGLLTAVLATVAGATGPMEYIARQGSDYVIVHTGSACTNDKILSVIPAEYQDKFRAAEAHVNGQDYKACFILHEEMVYLVYEDGDKGVIPASAFEPLKEA